MVEWFFFCRLTPFQDLFVLPRFFPQFAVQITGGARRLANATHPSAAIIAVTLCALPPPPRPAPPAAASCSPSLYVFCLVPVAAAGILRADADVDGRADAGGAAVMQCLCTPFTHYLPIACGGAQPRHEKGDSPRQGGNATARAPLRLRPARPRPSWLRKYSLTTCISHGRPSY